MGNLVAAFGLALILEGLMPLLSPRGWRAAVERVSALRDGQIRFFALLAVAAGGLLVVVA